MKQLYYALSLLLLCTLGACKDSKHTVAQSPANSDSTITEARLLVMDRQPQYTCVTIKDPWNEGKVLHTYVLVPRDSVLPAELPEGTVASADRMPGR